MKLDHPFLQLPLAFDAAELEREVAAISENAWRPHPQGYPGNDALALVSVGGDPSSDAVHGPMRPTPHLLACPYLMQVMQTIGAVWGRSRLMRLQGQAEVASHVDINYYWREHMRLHVPIVTQPTVRFVCDGQEINMAAGECWTFDTWRQHRVHNDDDRKRIHLVADTVGGPEFWRLMQNSRPHDAQREGWPIRFVAPQSSPAELMLESFNLPMVMSPWEARTHIDFLLDEIASPDAPDHLLCDLLRHFLRDWQSLWALHGDSGRGLDAYRERRDRLRIEVGPFEAVRLGNNVPFVKALQAIVISNLVATTARVSTSFGEPPIARGSAVTLSPSTTPTFRPVFKFGSVTPARPAIAPMKASVQPQAAASGLRFERPVIVLSAPRSGSTLLFETLARAPGLYTIGGESHRTFESLPGLHPAQRGFDSNRLAAQDATPQIVASLLANFALGLRDRGGSPPAAGAVRLLEKTPKNSLRVPFLRAAFPDASYVVLYREPNEVLASMIEAWQSGKFRTYPNLPGWTGPPWSLLLIPGWRELIGRPIEEVVARQWACTTEMLLDDIADLPAGRLTKVRYDEFLANPQREAERIAQANGLHWDIKLDALPLSKTTLTPPSPEKWRKHQSAIERIMPSILSTVERAERFFRADDLSGHAVSVAHP